MATLARDEEKRLRRLLKVALGAALAAGQIALPFACNENTSETKGTGGSGARSSANPTSSEGGGGSIDAGPDHEAIRDAKVSCDAEILVPDGAHDCEKFVHLGCGLPLDAGLYPGCYLGVNECTALCAGPAFNCRVSGNACADGSVPELAPQGGIDLECAVCLGDDGSVGRIPAGLLIRRGRARAATVGASLARAAELEAASVHAFRRLAAELEQHGAPRSLVHAAERARVDESRHARVVARLARREGGAPKRPRLRATPTRSLEAIALENAVEGTVRETFGALVASFQAARAEDAEVRRVYRTIAVEETRHAALASLVNRWALKKLGPAARRRVAAAERAALASLARSGSFAAPALRAVGTPTGVEHRALVTAFLATRAG